MTRRIRLVASVMELRFLHHEQDLQVPLESGLKPKTFALLLQLWRVHRREFGGLEGRLFVLFLTFNK